MIRFIDLRYQGTQNRFAFWNTVTDRFCSTDDGSQAWATWEEFEEDFVAGWVKPDQEMNQLQRCRSLCPPWVFQPPTDEELDFREEEA